MVEKLMPDNLLKNSRAKLDSQELLLLLQERIGGPGQVDSQASNYPNKFSLPLAREECRILLTFKKGSNDIIAVEPGRAFDRVQWNKISAEIENGILVGAPKIGREFSFSSHRVVGSWVGSRSGVQIFPPPRDASLANLEGAEHPFILEFPISEAVTPTITNYRRSREHRRLTMLLNVLLTARINFQTRRSQHFWAYIPASGSQWLQNWFDAPLDQVISDTVSPPAPVRIATIDRHTYYLSSRGHDAVRFAFQTISMRRFANLEIFPNRIRTNLSALCFGLISHRANGLYRCQRRSPRLCQQLNHLLSAAQPIKCFALNAPS
jgi:hypothetical protein